MEQECKICGRVKWGEWVPLGFGKWRHAECSIGSDSYAGYYQNLSAVEQKPLEHFFNISHAHKGVTDNEVQAST